MGSTNSRLVQPLTFPQKFLLVLTYGTYGRYSTYMPDVKIYIRTSDLEKWNSIQKKSEFMHTALEALEVLASPGKSRLYADIATRKAGEGHLELVEEVAPGSLVSIPSCCLNQKNRCKHWEFDGEASTWTNTRSGVVVSVDF